MSDPEPGSIIMQLLVIVLLTLVNAFFAGAEMAVVSVNKNKIKKLAENGNKKAVLIQNLSEDSTKFLSCIQVAITFAGFFSSASAATGISQLLGAWLKERGIPSADTLSMIVVTVILSYFTLVFGELVPKRIALQKAEKFSLFTVRPIHFISKIMSPFIALLSISTKAVLMLFGMNKGNNEETVSEEEIIAMVEEGSEQGIFNLREKERINSIFSFNDKKAKDVMKPRVEVFAINIDDPLDSYLDRLLECRYSRVPVYQGERDNIIGVLNMKDFMLEARKSSFEKVDIRKILSEPYFVPITKNADELLWELQTSKKHIAILIDEYGGFSGIVTVEDLVVEIIGDVMNECNVQESRIKQVDEHSYLVDGSMEIEDLNNKLGVELQSINYDTISGLLVEHMGHIPSEKEKPTIKIGNYVFKVQQVKEKRIDKVLFIIQPNYHEMELKME
ncbi:hemolysin family protein [Clostridium sp. Marseille-P299]|uniref:hemolysin family protein n=1 Tax=Clostridium sp. Marseille-P299 TaxID=1805477 RepID=UPI000831685A|nr:hemolysin family protein [Clostridium sp. Marseille-P299]